MAMPVVPKPQGKKLFGDKAVILLGGVDIAAMRRWQERVLVARNAKQLDKPKEEPGGTASDDEGSCN
jgi:hypothetical protein